MCAGACTYVAQVLQIQEVVRCIMQEKERLQAAHKQQLMQLTQALQQVSRPAGVIQLRQHVTLGLVPAVCATSVDTSVRLIPCKKWS